MTFLYVIMALIHFLAFLTVPLSSICSWLCGRNCLLDGFRFKGLVDDKLSVASDGELIARGLV